MNDLNHLGKELKSSDPFRILYDTYAAGVAYISVIGTNGNEGIGSAFHIGDGIFITARHVVEGKKIKEIGTTIYQRQYFEIDETRTTDAVRVNLQYTPQKTERFFGPYLHPDEKIDVAALVIPDIEAPILPLGDHLDDWLGNELILSSALVFGYPPIPFAKEPLLIVSKAEINAIVDKYTGGHPHFVLSTMARGGFSGGPALTDYGAVLGVVTESLVWNDQPTELGYLSIISVEGIYNCISHHHLVPKQIDKQWDGFWNTETTMFTDSSSPIGYNHVDVAIYRGDGEYYFNIYAFRLQILNNVLEVVDEQFSGFYSLVWIHDHMIKVEFKHGSITEEQINNIYISINKMIERMGINRV